MKSDTYQQVFEVADKLLASGVRPTQQAVREQLGRGSLTTINKALGEWWQLLGERLTAGQRYPELPEALSKSMLEWWQQAVEQSRREFELQHDRLVRDKRELKQLHQQRFEAQQSQLSDTLASLADQVEQQRLLQQQLEQQRQEQQALERRLLEAESAALEAARELKIQVSVQTKLENQNQQLRKQLEQARCDAGSGQLERENANLRALVDELDQKYNQLLQLVDNKR
jgi:flagellar biosynthesis GTPase FlhF